MKNTIHETHVTTIYWVVRHGPICHSMVAKCKAFASHEAAGRYIAENTKNLPPVAWYEIFRVDNWDADWDPHKRDRFDF